MFRKTHRDGRLLTMRLAIIVNPISGRKGRLSRTEADRLAHARRLVGDRPGVHAEIVATKAAGHAAELSRGFVEKGFDVVVAWGGDGTVNEVAGPIIGTPTALAIVPSGSGDGVVGSLELPRRPETAIAAALSGRPAAIDVGYLGGRHFINTAGIGFDAAMVAGFNAGRRRGLAGYVTRTATMIWSYRACHYELTLDDDPRAGVHMMIAFANGREYGNGMKLAPLANARDGWLDAVLVEQGSPWHLLWRARRLLFASHRAAHGIAHVRVRTASISGDHLQCHVDGESFEATGTLDVRLAPGALRVCGLETTSILPPLASPPGSEAGREARSGTR
jgi:diacylglycerol kinase (ATP)